jgi:hypothetical protein
MQREIGSISVPTPKKRKRKDGMSWFSADQAIGEYAKSVWHARF